MERFRFRWIERPVQFRWVGGARERFQSVTWQSAIMVGRSTALPPAASR